MTDSNEPNQSDDDASTSDTGSGDGPSEGEARRPKDVEQPATEEQPDVQPATTVSFGPQSGTERDDQVETGSFEDVFATFEGVLEDGLPTGADTDDGTDEPAVAPATNVSFEPETEADSEPDRSADTGALSGGDEIDQQLDAEPEETAITPATNVSFAPETETVSEPEERDSVDADAAVAGPVEYEGAQNATSEDSHEAPEARAGSEEPSVPDTDVGGLVEALPPLGTVVNAVGLVILVAVLLPFVAYAIPQVAGAEDSFVVTSGSMSPAIQQGDVVIVESVDGAAVSEGDVITFERSNSEMPTTHRVIDVDRSGDSVTFKTKGDANEGPDQGRVQEEQLVGRVAVSIPAIGHVISFGSSRLGSLLLLVLPLGLLAVLELVAFVRDDEGPDEPGDGSDPGGPPAAASEGGEDPVTHPREDTLAVQTTDLQLSLIVTAILAAYSGWMAYRTWAQTGIPDTASVSICAGSITALLLGLSMHVSVPSLDRSADDTEVIDVDAE
jgi:signal peptidase